MPSSPHPAPALRPRSGVPPLRSERLTVRPLASADVDAVHGYFSRADVCRYLPHRPMTREQVETKVMEAARSTALRDDGDFARLAVVRAVDDELVGEVVLSLVSVRSATAEIGWILAPGATGRGYATEAARALLRYAFTTLNAHRVIAQLHPDNAASARVCYRLGLRHEALHRADLWIKGGWEDTSVHAILRREWTESA